MALRFISACFNREDVLGPFSSNNLLYCQCSSVLKRGKLLRIFAGSLLISRGFGGAPIQLCMLQSRRFIWATFVELSSGMPVQFSAGKGEIIADFRWYSAYFPGIWWRSDSVVHASIAKIYLGHFR